VTRDFYRRVWCSIWREPWSEDARTVAFYLLTNEHSSTEGFYRLPLAYVPADLRWPERRFRAAFKELERVGFVEHDAEAHVVLVVKALKRNKPNSNQITAIVKALRTFPPTHLLSRFHSLAEDHSPPLAQALAEAFPESLAQAVA
jgi:hypothetical protein